MEDSIPLPYHNIDVASITVEERFREDYGDIQSLADSIKQEGLLHPVVIDESHRLLAGGRRLQAVKLLGWEKVHCHYIYELDDVARRRIELAENIHRKEITWQEKAKLTQEIQRMAQIDLGLTEEQVQQIDPQDRYAQAPFSTRTLAEIRGVSAMTIVRDLRLANALEIMPSLENETSQTNALRKIDRMMEDIERALELRAKRREVDAMQDYIKEGDATSLVLSLETNSVDCIITDPPYGTGNLDGNIYKYREGKDYDDSPEATLALLRSIGPELRRVLKPNGHLWAFFGPPLWQQTLDLWRKSGFEITNIIAVWYKSGGATGTVNWDYDLAPDWEPFILAHNRERKLASKHGATFVFPPDLGSNRLHPNQKPVALLRELITLSTQPGDTIFDPFAGSGSTAVAAKELGRKFIVFDNDHRNIQIIKERIVNTQGIPLPLAGSPVQPTDVVRDTDPSLSASREDLE